MRRSSLVVPLVLAAGLPLVLGQSLGGQDFGDAFTRERGTQLDSAKDALENAPPPALVGTMWRNTARPVRLAEHVGDVVVVQFWSARSADARLAMPVVDRLATRFADEGLVVVGVHPGQHVQDMLLFLRQHPVSYPVCVDAGPTQSDYVADGFPDYCLIDRFGTLRMADLADAELEEAIGMLLAEPGPGG